MYQQVSKSSVPELLPKSARALLKAPIHGGSRTFKCTYSFSERGYYITSPIHDNDIYLMDIHLSMNRRARARASACVARASGCGAGYYYYCYYLYYRYHDHYHQYHYQYCIIIIIIH